MTSFSKTYSKSYINGIYTTYKAYIFLLLLLYICNFQQIYYRFPSVLNMYVITSLLFFIQCNQQVNPCFLMFSCSIQTIILYASLKINNLYHHFVMYSQVIDFIGCFLDRIKLISISWKIGVSISPLCGHGFHFAVFFWAVVLSIFVVITSPSVADIALHKVSRCYA